MEQITTKQTNYPFYEDCEYCEGEGGQSEYCCSGMEDGVPSCGCGGYGSWNECEYCDEGKTITDYIEWDFESLDDKDEHDYQTYYTIIGKGTITSRQYMGTAIYTHNELDEIVDIEIN